MNFVYILFVNVIFFCKIKAIQISMLLKQLPILSLILEVYFF